MLRVSVLSLLLLGCGGADDLKGPSPSGPLVNLVDWTATESDRDPFLEFFSDQVRCTEDDHGPEVLAGVEAYSLETGSCNWLTIEQPSLSPVRAGDRIRASVWHFALSAPEPASARVALATDEGILVQIMEPIPQAGRLIELDFVAQTAIAANTPIYFHISNHGANSWHLLDIQINPETAAQ